MSIAEDSWLEYLLRQTEARITGLPLSVEEAAQLDKEACEFASQQRDPWGDEDTSLELFPAWPPSEGK